MKIQTYPIANDQVEGAGQKGQYKMIHTLSGHNFHGRFEIQLRGPKEGFALSDSQWAKIDKTLCGMADCCCGGGYGDGYDDDSAQIVDHWLKPAFVYDEYEDSTP
jgi:hypothetical protein